ncbi:MAG: mannose-6-phosphate isomerase, class I, partial [Rectinemataceae bacterium]
MRIHRLDNQVMAYPWGSADGLSKTLDIGNPGSGPRAEMWMGAHPRGASELLLPEGKLRLDEAIARDPVGMLGGDCLARCGEQLPFLFKALSAERPLSIQVHPDKGRAERGFARENASGIPVDAPTRNYRDPNHKPEVSVALLPFEALCGFRPIEEIIAFSPLYASSEIVKNLERLEGQPSRIELSMFFYSLMSLGAEERMKLLEELLPKVTEALGSESLSAADRGALAWVRRLAELWPGDIGAVMPLLLNHLVLEPGQGIYIAPGEPHAYLLGTCLELMANSDNVIRGALSEKHIDMMEFISALSFSAGKPQVLERAGSAEGGARAAEGVYNCPVEDFLLSAVRPGTALAVRGPEIVLAGEGPLFLRSGGGTLELHRGQSAFVRADAGNYDLSGEGLLWRARVGLAAPPGLAAP